MGINIDGLKEGDQILVRLVTNTYLDAELYDSTVHLERGTRNQFSLKGSFNETCLFFIADSESHDLLLRMKHPNTPFRVTDGLHDDLSTNITSDGSSLVIELRDNGMDGEGSLFRMAYPFEILLGDDFRFNLKYAVTEGEVSNVLFDVFDDTDEWLYSFVASEDFVLEPDTVDIYGKSNLINDRISLVAFLIFLEDGSSASYKLKELSINGNESYSVDFYADNNEEIFYEVFIERDFNPSFIYSATLVSGVFLGVVTLYLLYRRIK
jgi:hypothetical protein